MLRDVVFKDFKHQKNVIYIYIYIYIYTAMVIVSGILVLFFVLYDFGNAKSLSIMQLF